MPNIILISLDTTRADHLSCYGYHRLTSPHLDKFASRGVIFDSHFSPHIPTYPGHTTMMSGKDIYAHRVTGQSGTPEPQNIRLLAEILQQEGYFTAAADNLGRWFTNGFDHIENYKWDSSAKTEMRKGEAVAGAAMRTIDLAARQDKPFFLFWHFWDPHTPYLPPKPFDRMFYSGDEKNPSNNSLDEMWGFKAFNRYFAEWMPGVTDVEYPIAQYDAEIAYMDTCLASLWTHLEDQGLAEDTLIIVTADHGEELDEHQHWFDHHGLYDTNLHIPLILSCPGLMPSGLRINGLTQMMDITPTILDFLELGHIVIAEGMQGRSLLPLIENPTSAARGSTDILHITENTWMKKRGVRTNNWKLIVPLETPDLHGKSEVELYDLSVDPGELNNLAALLPEKVGELKFTMTAHLEHRMQETGLPDPLPEQPLPLRQIGNLETAVPKPDRPIPSGQDAKLNSGDFIGYAREE